MEKDPAPNTITSTTLSAREREVAELVVHGKSNRAIADALFLSERTVESHVSSIFNRLNVRSRVELAGAVLRGAVEAGSKTPRGRLTSNNLPIQPTSFLGREHDVEEVKSQVEQHSLVTVWGAGGVGKTRLALRVGADVLDRYPIRSILRGYPVALLTAPASAGGIYSGGRFNISVDAWVGGSDPEASEYLACDQRPPKGSNYTGWCDARYDRLFALQRTNDDQRVRRNAFLGMQRLVHDAYVEDFLAYGARYISVNRSLVNFHPNMLYEFWNSDKWDVLQGKVDPSADKAGVPITTLAAILGHDPVMLIGSTGIRFPQPKTAPQEPCKQPSQACRKAGKKWHAWPR